MNNQISPNEEKIKACTKHDENNIIGFFGEYRFLSNFHIAEVKFEFNYYPSSEHAYQAAKCLKFEDRLKFINSYMTCAQAKKQGQLVAIRPDWDQVKDHIMYDVCFNKFLRHNDLKQKLLATGEKHLEEANWWKDTYWGTFNGEGLNKLGMTLMKIRENIKINYE